MLPHLETNNALIAKWSTLRNRMLGLLSRILKLQPFDDEMDEMVDSDLIQEFCKSLQEYITIGDLNLFNAVQKSDDAKIKQTLTNRFYALLDTTDSIIDFNDKYFLVEDIEAISLLEKITDLNSLAEGIATRLDLEDLLLQAMLSANLLDIVA